MAKFPWKEDPSLLFYSTGGIVTYPVCIVCMQEVCWGGVQSFKTNEKKKQRTYLFWRIRAFLEGFEYIIWPPTHIQPPSS